MEIIKLPDAETINEAIISDEPMIAVVSFDRSIAAVAPVRYSSGHELLAAAAGMYEDNSYFRVTFTSESADWSFDCPQRYKGIPEPDERTAAYYRDGLSIIPEFLIMIGYFSKLRIRNAPPDIWEF